MFNKYCITAISYSIARNLYYCKNIHITETNKEITINRPLLVGEILASVGFGIMIALPLFPFALINDIIYIERKQKKLCLHDTIPQSIYLGCFLIPRSKVNHK